MKGTVNVGVIGAGRIGVVHLEALASCAEATPIIISNPTVSKAEAAAKKLMLWDPCPGVVLGRASEPHRRRPDQGLLQGQSLNGMDGLVVQKFPGISETPREQQELDKQKGRIDYYMAVAGAFIILIQN